MTTPDNDPIDLEAEISKALRADRAIAVLVADRVYTARPNEPTWPLILIKTIGGTTLINRPLWLEQTLVQFDCYGGSRKTAAAIASTLRTRIAAWPEEGVRTGKVTFTDTDPAAARPLPDAAYTPARPRYIVDVTIHHHPTRAPATSGHH